MNKVVSHFFGLTVLSLLFPLGALAAPTVTFSVVDVTHPAGGPPGPMNIFENDTIQYSWTTTGATSVSSYVYVNYNKGIKDGCGVSSGPWAIGQTPYTQLSGSFSAAVATCQGDAFYSLTVTATASNGTTATATQQVQVVPFSISFTVNGLQANNQNVLVPSIGFPLSFVWSASPTNLIKATYSELVILNNPDAPDACGTPNSENWDMTGTSGSYTTANLATCNSGYTYVYSYWGESLLGNWYSVNLTVAVPGTAGASTGIVAQLPPIGFFPAPPPGTFFSGSVTTAQPVPAPFGNLDTPANGSTNLAGAIGVTGWALSAISVQSVGIYRAPVPSDSPASIGANGLVYVGLATMVPQARPDVAATYPNYPSNSMGWGIQVLTNVLPPGIGSTTMGNGQYTFYAVAYDMYGHGTRLNATTVTVNNAASQTPFGAIDNPPAGATISGTAYTVSGWALTPPPNTIASNGITLYIDNVASGTLTYGEYRSDIASLFPTYKNSSGAGASIVINTTKYTNGQHTISWSAKDGAGNVGGIGSRFFYIQN